jgi:hypothetical protein
MKGPHARTKHDVRRVWECPACARRLLTGGQVVNLSCDCQATADPPRRTAMRLVEPPKPPRTKSDAPEKEG